MNIFHQIRNALGLNQQSLANLLGVSLALLKKAETNQRNLSGTLCPPYLRIACRTISGCRSCWYSWLWPFCYLQRKMRKPGGLETHGKTNQV
jgi:transcriptional regulator with XRE-family HTH domain